MTKRHALIAGLVLALGGVGFYIALRTQPRKDRPVVAITQIASHPALDEVREGIIDGLKKRGYTDGENIEIMFKNADGDASLTLAIAQDFARRSPAVIVPVT